MSNQIDVTKYYRDCLTKVPGHYWQVRIEEKKYGDHWCVAGDYELDLTLWQRGWQVAIKASVGAYIKPNLGVHSVQELVRNLSRDVAGLMEITPKPRGGFYLIHSSYAFQGRNEWRTRVDRYDIKKVVRAEVAYDLALEDYEDLAHRFEELLSNARKTDGLPAFVTGGN